MQLDLPEQPGHVSQAPDLPPPGADHAVAGASAAASEPGSIADQARSATVQTTVRSQRYPRWHDHWRGRSAERRYTAARTRAVYHHGYDQRALSRGADASQSGPPAQSATTATIASGAHAPEAPAAPTDEGRRSALDRYHKQMADTQAATAAYAADRAAYEQELARSRKAKEEYDQRRPKTDH